MGSMLYPIFMMVASFGAGMGLAWFLWKKDSDAGSKQDSADGGYPFHGAPNFLDENERMLYTALGYASGSGTVILAKVRLIDLIDLPRGSRRTFFINLARSRRVDYVIADAKKMTPVAAVLLDSSQGMANTEEDQAFAENALRAARIPVVRVTARDGQDPAGLKDRIHNAITDMLDSHM